MINPEMPKTEHDVLMQVRKLKRMRKILQKELAIKADVSEPTISRMLLKRQQITKKAIATFADVLETENTGNDLFGGKKREKVLNIMVMDYWRNLNR